MPIKLGNGICIWCGAEFAKKRDWQETCSKDCGKTYRSYLSRESYKRGRIIVQDELRILSQKKHSELMGELKPN